MQRFDDESKMIAKITIPPQSSIGLHQHINDEEIIYVIEGQGICISDGKEFEISKGLVNYTRRGESHSIKNTSDHELVLLAIIFK
jgi:quercetin dioxygenase-like cupin family protein